MLSRKPLNAAPQSAAMLRHVVERTLEGRATELKAYTIAVDALGKPRSFDPQLDPGVRVLARSLRKSLAEYYANEGRGETVEIAIPTGRYEPLFRRRGGEKPPSSGRRLRFALAAAGAATMVAAIAWFATPQSRGAAADLHLPHVERFEGPRLLVQPFAFAADPTRDPPAEELAAAITVEIVAAMSAYPWLSVIQLPEQPLASFVEKAADRGGLPHYVLSGRVAERSGSLVVAVTLSSFPQLAVKWSGVFREPLGSAGAERIERELSGRIAALVGSENGVVPELVKSDPPPALAIDIDAFRCLLEIYPYWRRPDAAGHRMLAECLPRAVARNPGHAEAWAALAWVRMDEARFGRNARSGADPWAEAQAAIGRALALAPLSPLVLRTAMAIAIEQPQPDLAAFERHGRRNLQLRPNDANALAEFGGRLAVNAGKWDEGMRLVARAFDLNPAPPGWYFFAPAASALMERDEDALAVAASAMAFPEAFPDLLIRAIAAAHAGDEPQLVRLKAGLASIGVVDASSAVREIAVRSFEPGLKALLTGEAGKLFGAPDGARG